MDRRRPARRPRRRMLMLAGLAGLLGGLLVYRQRAIDASARQFRAIYDQREEHVPES